jgi:hypothetical protein
VGGCEEEEAQGSAKCNDVKSQRRPEATGNANS